MIPTSKIIFEISQVNASSTPKWPTLRFRKGPQFGHFALQLAFLLMVEGHFALQLAFR